MYKLQHIVRSCCKIIFKIKLCNATKPKNNAYARKKTIRQIWMAVQTKTRQALGVLCLPIKTKPAKLFYKIELSEIH